MDFPISTVWPGLGTTFSAVFSKNEKQSARAETQKKQTPVGIAETMEGNNAHRISSRAMPAFLLQLGHRFLPVERPAIPDIGFLPKHPIQF